MVIYKFIIVLLIYNIKIHSILIVKPLKNIHLDTPLSKNIYNLSKINYSESYLEKLKNKKLITISPGGYKGVYMFGICAFIKDNYDLSDYIFSGASAGAWNALMMTCKNTDIYNNNKIISHSIKQSKNMFESENLIKEQILKKYTTDDFHLDKLFIGVTTVEECHTYTSIYDNFKNLEDAINCCISSSHIPLLTGGLLNIYRNKLSFDGGFSRYPYIHLMKSELHITPDIWKNVINKNEYREFTTLFSKNKYNFDQLFQDGYNDSKQNKSFLDEIFNKKCED